MDLCLHQSFHLAPWQKLKVLLVQTCFQLNLQFAHTTPLVNGVSVSKPVASMSGISVTGDISLANVKAYAKAGLPSQYGSDTVKPTGTSSAAAKTANIAAVGTKRGLVNRPVRRFGPPPGFGSVPYKLPDNSKVDSLSHASGTSLVSEQTDQRNEQPQIDDYSWLDGYTSSNKDTEREDPLGCHPSHSFLPTGDNLINDVANFPFPGKQVSNTQRVQEQQEFQTRQQLEYKVTQQQQHSLWSGLYFGQINMFLDRPTLLLKWILLGILHRSSCLGHPAKLGLVPSSLLKSSV